ncbi:MAG: hypothetical protein KJO44_08895, partial [Gemmatimonadetes bacterium]|nr:hypothetical protein [Gemmatimonadota bacterium]
MQQKTAESRETPALRGLRLLGPYRFALVGVVGLLFSLAAVDLLQPYLLKLLIDDVFIGRLVPEATERVNNWNLL